MKKQLLRWWWLGMLPAFNLWAVEGDVRLDPATTAVALNSAFGLKMLVDSGTKKLGAYTVSLTYDATKLQVDATTPTTNGANPLTSVFMVNATVAGTLKVAGVQAQGVGPGASLHPVTANFKCLSTVGSYPVKLVVETLNNEGDKPIGAATPRPGVGSTVNCSVITPKPDFVITGVTAITPAAPVVGGTFSATVTVKNQGTASGDGKMLSVWAHQLTAPICSAAGWAKQVAVGVLAVGQSRAITFTSTTAIPVGAISGTKMLRAFVDSNCATVETNEMISDQAPNQNTALYTVVAPATPATPDFVITGITFTPAVPVANAAFTANVTVKNQGTVAGDAKMLSVWRHQPSLQACGAGSWGKQVPVGVLKASEAKIIPVAGLMAGAAGGRSLRAYVDSACGINEANEVNNQVLKAY